MVNELQLGYQKFITAAIITILLKLFIAPAVTGQIIVSDVDFTRILFSENEEYTGSGIQVLNLHNLKISGKHAFLTSGYRFPWSESVDAAKGEAKPVYKISEIDGITALVLDLNKEKNAVFGTFKIKNNTENLLEGFSLTFNWAVKGESEINLVYTYKSPFSGMKTAQTTGSELIPEERKNGMISIQEKVSINDILLKPDDELTFRIILNSNTDHSVIGLEGIDVKPSMFKNEKSINAGSVLISEVLPVVETPDGEIQFIEIYNASSDPISLKGMEFVTQNYTGMIEKDITLEPHRFFVAGKSGISNLSFQFDYELQDLTLSPSGGSLKIVYMNRELAKASYNSISGLNSWELTEFAEAYDGYSGMNFFRESDELLTEGIKASPGYAGKSLRIFTYYLDTHAWYLLSAPGTLANSLNKNFRYPLYSLKYEDEREDSFWNPVSINEINDGQTVLFHVSEEFPGNKLTAVENSLQSEFYYHPASNLPFSIAGNPFPHSITTANLQLENGESFSGAVQVWNPQDETFEVVKTGSRDSISAWQGFIYQSNSSESGIVVTKNPGNTVDQNSPSISFGLSVGNERESPNTDRAATVEFDLSQGSEKNNYHNKSLPKFFPISIHNQSNRENFALLYITETENSAPKSYLKFINQQSRPVSEFYLSAYSSSFGSNGTLNWNMQNMSQAREEFILHDIKTGEQLIMNDEGRYTFTFAQDEINLLPTTSNTPELTVIGENKIKPRFRVEIKSVQTENIINESTGEEIPDKIVLDQNYPNPFNPATTIRFYLPEQTAVKISVFNIVGQRVATLVENVLSEGDHSITWDASEMPSGIYIVQLETGNRVLTRKMTLLK